MNSYKTATLAGQEPRRQEKHRQEQRRQRGNVEAGDDDEEEEPLDTGNFEADDLTGSAVDDNKAGDDDDDNGKDFDSEKDSENGDPVDSEKDSTEQRGNVAGDDEEEEPLDSGNFEETTSFDSSTFDEEFKSKVPISISDEGFNDEEFDEELNTSVGGAPVQPQQERKYRYVKSLNKDSCLINGVNVDGARGRRRRRGIWNENQLLAAGVSFLDLFPQKLSSLLLYQQ